MNKHSKGPWIVREIELHEGGKGIEVRDAEGDAVCNNQTYYPAALKPENAPIIAAAPDMLLVLELLVAIYDSNTTGYLVGDAFDKARNLIKKVRGL